MAPRANAEPSKRTQDVSLMSALNEPSVFSLSFGSPGADGPFLLDGWSDPESPFRWAIGPQSALRLPALPREDYFLTLKLVPVPLAERPSQRITLVINDVIAHRFDVGAPGEYAIFLPKDLIRRGKDNSLRFLFGHFAAPGELQANEERPLAVAFYGLSIDAADFEPLARTALLPLPPVEEGVATDLKRLAERFQSLGQNSEFGLWQRRCEAEPAGLLRFASLRMEHLLRGLRTDFQGIADASQIKLNTHATDGEYIGHHAAYEMDYHTGKFTSRVKLDRLTRDEPERLGELARQLLEQIDNAEKIFVVHRWDLLNDENVLPLFLALRARNPEVRLLYVTGLAGSNLGFAGRVEQTAPGLYHGYLARLAPSENAYDSDFEGWVKLCSAVDLAVEDG